MDDQTRSGYETQSQNLRLELKAWETTWAKSHDGKKPGREDIKKNADIAQKYKQYQRTRDILEGKAAPPTKDRPKPTKRKSAPPLTDTPAKRTKHDQTPSKNRMLAVEGLQETPGTSRKLFSPSSVTSLGPTPQRDGRVLGLFDLLVEKDFASPSRNDTNGRPDARSTIHATPSKRNADLDVEATPKMGRTPMSASKRQLLNTFMTPLKKRDGNSVAKTPSSVSKLQFDTPQFLKRHSMPTGDENGQFEAPALRLPRKPLGRGLSEIVATLRKVEEDYHEDDMDALREMEDGESGRPKSAPKPRTTTDETILEKDSQSGQLILGGFDNEEMYDSAGEDGKAGKDTNGNPLRVFKKKGQKRTTRLAKMRPTWIKRPTETAENLDHDEDNADAVPETQLDTYAPDGASDSEFDGGNASRPTKKQKEKGKKKDKDKAKASGKQAEEGTVKKAARKVNELAHANFRRLKVRNNGAKGGPGYNSKFRRRR